MLQITIPETELWDESKSEFIQIKAQTLSLEHSLVSISKWESKWCKPFLATKEMTTEETLDYIRCMTLTQNVNPITYKAVTQSIVDEIVEYSFVSIRRITCRYRWLCVLIFITIRHSKLKQKFYLYLL